MCAVAEKPHDAVVQFDTYRNVSKLQRHRAVLPVTERVLLMIAIEFPMKKVYYSQPYHAVYTANAGVVKSEI